MAVVLTLEEQEQVVSQSTKLGSSSTVRDVVSQVNGKTVEGSWRELYLPHLNACTWANTYTCVHVYTSTQQSVSDHPPKWEVHSHSNLLQVKKVQDLKNKNKYGNNKAINQQRAFKQETLLKHQWREVKAVWVTYGIDVHLGRSSRTRLSLSDFSPLRGDLACHQETQMRWEMENSSFTAK